MKEQEITIPLARSAKAYKSADKSTDSGYKLGFLMDSDELDLLTSACGGMPFTTSETNEKIFVQHSPIHNLFDAVNAAGLECQNGHVSIG